MNKKQGKQLTHGVLRVPGIHQGAIRTTLYVVPAQLIFDFVIHMQMMNIPDVSIMQRTCI